MGSNATGGLPTFSVIWAPTFSACELAAVFLLPYQRRECFTYTRRRSPQTACLGVGPRGADKWRVEWNGILTQRANYLGLRAAATTFSGSLRRISIDSKPAFSSS
jgi:hypothetical protein